jgi:SRSO17 transposase
MNEHRRERLEAYLAPFLADFRRRDQARWAAVYVQGLLLPGERKTVENMARRIVLPHELVVEDVAQALQNFIHHSPWDERKLWQRHREQSARQLAGEEGCFVIEEMAFEKQGRHSVGVQRQFASALGRKTNCQIAVAVHWLTASALMPLALRLYLPRGWLQDRERLDVACVPEADRRLLGKTPLALELLDEVRTLFPAGEVFASSNGNGQEELADALASRGLTLSAALPPESKTRWVEEQRRLREELGLDHFEGRSWRGFHHHACLVALAQGFVAQERDPIPVDH